MKLWRAAARRWPAVLAGAAILAAAAAAWFAHDSRILAAPREFASAHPVSAALAYVAVYVGFAVLSLPGIGTLSVAAGAAFGVWLGLPLAMASNAAGATLAMLIARHLLRDAVAQRFPRIVAQANAGVARDGAVWLLAARLAPVLPFAAVNFAAGLTQMPTAVFAATSLVGETPLTVLYVLTGANLTSSGDLLSARTIALFGALGAVALALPPLARRLRRS